MTGPEITSSSSESHQKHGAIERNAFSQREVTAAPVSKSRELKMTYMTHLAFYPSGAGRSLNLLTPTLIFPENQWGGDTNLQCIHHSEKHGKNCIIKMILSIQSYMGILVL